MSVTSAVFKRLSFTAPRNCVTKSGRKRRSRSRWSCDSAMMSSGVLDGRVIDLQHAPARLCQHRCKWAHLSLQAAIGLEGGGLHDDAHDKRGGEIGIAL